MWFLLALSSVPSQSPLTSDLQLSSQLFPLFLVAINSARPRRNGDIQNTRHFNGTGPPHLAPGSSNNSPLFSPRSELPDRLSVQESVGHLSVSPAQSRRPSNQSSPCRYYYSLGLDPDLGTYYYNDSQSGANQGGKTPHLGDRAPANNLLSQPSNAAVKNNNPSSDAKRQHPLYKGKPTGTAAMPTTDLDPDTYYREGQTAFWQVCC